MRPSGPFHAKADDPCTSQPRRRRSACSPGVRVADFSRVLAGPYATMTLADFGADVIKVEPPTGDDTRHWKPPSMRPARPRTSAASTATSARSHSTSDRRGPRRGSRLAASADVVVENFRPGVMDRFGLSDADLRAGEPRPRLLLDHGVRPGRDARRIRPARAGRRRPHVDHGRARRRAVQGRGRPRRRALRAERRRRDPARPARARPHRPRPAGRGEPPPEPALRLVNQAASTRPPGARPGASATGTRASRRTPCSRRRSRPRHRGRQRPAVPPLTGAPRHPGLADDPATRPTRARVAHRDHLRAELEAALAAHRRALVAGALRRRRARGPRERRGRGDRLRRVASASIRSSSSVPSRTVANPIALSDAAPLPHRRRRALDEHAGADWLPDLPPRKDPPHDHGPPRRPGLRPRRPPQRGGARLAAARRAFAQERILPIIEEDFEQRHFRRELVRSSASRASSACT